MLKIPSRRTMARPETTSGADSSAPSQPAKPANQTKQSKRARRHGIFLSYRRSDSMTATGRLYERLAKRYGKQHVFRDVDGLEGGADFAKTIQESIPQSAVALVIMGRT